jgi:hypothetical protein
MRLNKRIIVSAFAALLGTVVIAKATNTTFFTSIGDLIFPFGVPSQTGTGGTIGDPVRGGMAPVNGNLSYAKKGNVGVGFSYYFGNWQADMLLEPTATVSSGALYMAPNPIDGGKACVFTLAAVSSFTWGANVGQTINNAVTSLAANSKTCYLYSASNSTWDRSN